jgi:hypothetical protein
MKSTNYIEEESIEITLGGIADKSLRESAISVINSHAGELTEDDFIHELAAIDQIGDEEKLERYERNRTAQYRRIFGTFKTKGNRQIQDALSEQMMLCLPLDEGGVVELETGSVVPFRHTTKQHLQSHRAINQAKREAKKSVLDAADQAEEEAIRHILDRMEDGKTLGDYDDGKGYAIL